MSVKRVKGKIYVAELPLVSRDYAEALDKKFPILQPAPGISRDDLLYNAGMRKVVDTVLNSANSKEISGNPDDLIHYEEDRPSLLNKILGGLKR